MKRNLISVGGALAAAAFVASASGAVPSPLVGTWGKTMTASTWARNHVGGKPGGHFAIAIDKGGVTKMYYGVDPTTTKSFTYPFTTMRTAVQGRTLTFGPTTDGHCPGGATYTWTASGGKLSLKLVKDGCDARRVLMIAGAFVRE